ncbi:MAG: CotH kinase family protein [Clostridia bacterium]|nr:CotH kinase family protein [Clostridia bacterium]
MISSKHITKIGIVLISIVLVLCIVGMIYSEQLAVTVGVQGYAMEYEEKLFNTENGIDINITIESAKWEEMMNNAMAEEYYECDISINGESFYKVGIRPKGNTSLSTIARDPDNNRYSFKVEFDRFVDGQTCFGLDKLVLNNGYADATFMKEAIIYDMFSYLGADAPLYNFAKVSVNGEYWGVYLALEGVEDSFLLRNYGGEKGNLYKPDNMGFSNRGEKGESNNFQPPQMTGGERRNNGENPFGGMTREETEEEFRQIRENGEFKRPDGGNFGGFGARGSGNGANLNYIDDNPDSYSAIWNSAKTSVDDAAKLRVVEALKNIGTSTNIEKYMDVDNILRYMAVHNFAVNEDSLSGGMAHNYYLYESGGKLNILPWDYNLAFGGMHSRDASSMVNDPIDDSYSSTTFFDPLLNTEAYRAKYHEYYNELISGYFDSGRFDATYNRIRSQIDELVKADPTAMYSYDEYVMAADMLYDVLKFRAESVRGQLAGTIPSTTEGQRTDSSALVDASSIDINIMGQMMGGKPLEVRSNSEKVNSE